MKQLIEAQPDINWFFVAFNSRMEERNSVAKYLKAFHPSLQGIAGEEDVIKEFAKQLGANLRQTDTSTFNHTTSLFVLDPTVVVILSTKMVSHLFDMPMPPSEILAHELRHSWFRKGRFNVFHFIYPNCSCTATLVKSLQQRKAKGILRIHKL